MISIAVLAAASSLYVAATGLSDASRATVQAAMTCVARQAAALEPSGEAAQDVATAAIAACAQQVNDGANAILTDVDVPEMQHRPVVEAFRQSARDGAVLVITRIRACEHTPGCDRKAILP